MPSGRDAAVAAPLSQWLSRRRILTLHPKERSMQIEKLDLALDDLDGLLEAHRALGDPDRSDALRLAPDGVAALRRELAEAMDSYAATLVASAGGELTAKRLDKCRRDAQSRMKGAVARQDQLLKVIK